MIANAAGSVGNLFIQALFTYKGLFGWWTPSAYLPQVLIRPALMVILFGLIGRYAINEEASRELVVGRVAYSIVWIHIVSIVQCFYYERAGRTASVVYSTPCNRFVNYIARGLLHFPNGPVVTISAFLGAWVAFQIDLEAINFGAVAVAVLVLSLSSIGFSLFAGSIGFAVRNYQTLYFTMAGIVLVLTGSVIPVDELPEVAQVFSAALPLTHGLEAFRAYFDGQGLGAHADKLALELLVGAAYLLVGYGLFKAVELSTRRSGGLDRALA